MARRTDEQVRIGAETQQAEKGFRKLGPMAKAAVAAVAAAIAAGLTSVVKSSIALFRVQELSDRRLRRSLVATGQYSKEYEEQLKGIADNLQKLTIVGDEVSQNIIQNLVTVGKVSRENIEDATLAVIGIAEQQGKSVERVNRTVAKSLSDIADASKASIGELEQFLTAAQVETIRHLKETEGGLVAQAAAVEMLSERYGEHALAVEGSTDVYVQASNAWGDLVEAAGQFFHYFTGPIMGLAVAGMQRLADIIERINDGLDTGREAQARRAVEQAQTALEAAIEHGNEHLITQARALLEQRQAELERIIGPPGGGGPDDPGGPGGPESDEARWLRLRSELLRQELEGMERAELEHSRRVLQIAREREEALRLIEDDATRAQGEAMLENLQLQYELSVQTRNQQQADELARQQAHNERMLEEQRRAAEEQRRAEEEAQQQRIEDQRGFFNSLISIAQKGGSKMSGLAKAAARGLLLLDLATKPQAAYAKTSAAYPWPLGPILGAIHAGAVVAQIASGLSKVGGGGSAPSIAQPPAMADTLGAAPDTEGAAGTGKRPPIILHATIEADGQSIASVVQRQIEYAENN